MLVLLVKMAILRQESSPRWCSLPRVNFNERFAFLCPKNRRVSSHALGNFKDLFTIYSKFGRVLRVWLHHALVHRNRHESVLDLLDVR
jgi:hypothetical protein